MNSEFTALRRVAGGSESAGRIARRWGRSTSAVAAVAASSLPERLVLQLPEDDMFEHAGATSEREDPEIFGH